eukprot:scaffold277596_cov33-Tisochrysis_lutea.AAC.2
MGSSQQRQTTSGCPVWKPNGMRCERTREQNILDWIAMRDAVTCFRASRKAAKCCARLNAEDTCSTVQCSKARVPVVRRGTFKPASIP